MLEASSDHDRSSLDRVKASSVMPEAIRTMPEAMRAVPTSVRSTQRAMAEDFVVPKESMRVPYPCKGYVGASRRVYRLNLTIPSRFHSAKSRDYLIQIRICHLGVCRVIWNYVLCAMTRWQQLWCQCHWQSTK